MIHLCLAALACLAGQPPEAPAPLPPGVEETQGEIIRYYPEHREIVVAEFRGGERLFVLSDDVKITKANRPVPLKELKEFIAATIRYRRAGAKWIALEVMLRDRVFMHMAPRMAEAESNNILATVNVFFATDRAASADLSGWRRYWIGMRWAVLAGGATILVMIAARLRGRAALSWLSALGLMATAWLAAVGYSGELRVTGGALPPDQLFGGGRGSELVLGKCTVTLPREHQLGRLESPSLARFEFRFDPEKHVTLQTVDRLPRDEFFTELSAVLERCPRRELLVFIHGYNQTFAEAARRTAQLAYDLEFDGPALFFSWPSQGGLAQYTIDESNVEFATPDLRDFLSALAARSGARSIQLVAHSMGNRVLTGALRLLATDPAHRPELYREVVLAAPDIDASVFERELFPAIRGKARRYTLYASSNDNALRASKTVHGHPRAGDSGELLVILPGLETIDVSNIDTSLMGHSYYGESKSVITDLYHVVKRGEPPQKRMWLKPMERRRNPYWMFQILDNFE